MNLAKLLDPIYAVGINTAVVVPPYRAVRTKPQHARDWVNSKCSINDASFSLLSVRVQC
jgi:hypothetical protein